MRLTVLLIFPLIGAIELISPTHKISWLVSVTLFFAGVAVSWYFIVREGQRIGWRQSGRCPVCGYDLRATPHRCPECGTMTKISN
jgi:hypothetical protein